MKFLDPQIKLIIDLRDEIRRLRRENEELRGSLVSAPSGNSAAHYLCIIFFLFLRINYCYVNSSLDFRPDPSQDFPRVALQPSKSDHDLLPSKYTNSVSEKNVKGSEINSENDSFNSKEKENSSINTKKRHSISGIAKENAIVPSSESSAVNSNSSNNQRNRNRVNHPSSKLPSVQSNMKVRILLC